VCYAAKAYCAPWLLSVIAEEGLGLDVVSGGELFVARRADFPLARTYFHGNNKSEEELRLALELGIGRIVLDNLDEIHLLGRLAHAAGRQQAVLLRVTPGVEAHTHEYIKTGVLDTKFGLSLETGAAEEGVRATLAEPGLRLLGLHTHIGSQLFDMAPYREAIQRVLAFAARMRERHGFRLRELSPGGGFGMRYTPADDPPRPEEVARALAEAVSAAAGTAGFGDSLPAITIEPGRSIVGPAGVALYRVGSVKGIPGVRTYVAVDGGMADNIRPTTYGAVYSPLLANRASEPATATVAIAGKYCESGDILVREAKVPPPRIGDLVAVPGSGAYHLAMASNYNLALRPAVVVVANGDARLVRRRETYEDLLRAEL
jgi:diaminopimelate decarboxylase